LGPPLPTPTAIAQLIQFQWVGAQPAQFTWHSVGAEQRERNLHAPSFSQWPKFNLTRQLGIVAINMDVGHLTVFQIGLAGPVETFHGFTKHFIQIWKRSEEVFISFFGHPKRSPGRIELPQRSQPMEKSSSLIFTTN
jgi:hypothetical protein